MFRCDRRSVRKDLRGDQCSGWSEGSGSATDSDKRLDSAPEPRACQWEPHFRNAHLMDAGGRIRLGEYNFLPLQLLAAHLVSSLRRHGCRIG